MATAAIKINGTLASNLNFTIDTTATLTNNNDTGVSSWLWSIIDQPAGTPDNLSSTTTAAPTLRCKKEGTYVIKLVVNGDATITDTKILAVLQVVSQMRIPGAGETTQASTARGWAADMNLLQQYLLSRTQNPMVLVGVAGAVGLDAGTVMYVSGTAIIKSGLPSQETLPKFSAMLATGSDTHSYTDSLYLSLGGVDGDTTPSSGAVIYGMLMGVYPLAAATTGVTVGNPIYVFRDATIGIADRQPRRVGYQITSTYIYFNGQMGGAVATDLLDTTLSQVPVGAAASCRVVSRGGRLQVSEAAGAYTSLQMNVQGANVAAANNLVLGADGGTFAITGAIQINLLATTNFQNGARVTLVFASTPTVKHATATSGVNTTILLAGAVDFVATANDTLTLLLCTDGTTQAWREVSRAVI